MAGYNPGGFKISNNKVKEIITLLNLDKDDIKSIKRNSKLVKNTLKSGDMQLAKVISLNPLLIACFSDEPIDSIMSKIGITNRSFFYKEIKKRFNSTPLNLRKLKHS